MLRAPLRILIVAALCVAALIGLVVREGMARASGQEVILPMAAVDPRALLTGHYVIVDLVEPLPTDQDCPPHATDMEGIATPEWIALRPDGLIHRIAAGAATRNEALQSGPIAVRGTYFCNPAIRSEDNVVLQPATLRMNLGVERFHINQTEAERIQGVMQSQQPGEEVRVFAILSIGADGRARLNGLMVDDERLLLNWY